MLDRELMEAMVAERMREAATWRLAQEAMLNAASSGHPSPQQPDARAGRCRSSGLPFVALVKPGEQRRTRCCTCS